LEAEIQHYIEEELCAEEENQHIVNQQIFIEAGNQQCIEHLHQEENQMHADCWLLLEHEERDRLEAECRVRIQDIANKMREASPSGFYL